MNESTLVPLLRLTLTPGLGPVLIGRALARFGSAEGVLGASASELKQVKGLRQPESIARGLAQSLEPARRELELAQRLGVGLLVRGEPGYPPLLAPLEDAPAILYVRGALDPEAADRFPVAIVGSRDATAYGIEQAERFGADLARAGMVVVSGGARGIDSAAHRGALRAGGRTVAVLGCGLAECYPPDNAELFARIADGRGAVVSELPLRTGPDRKNFPARNRLISGMSLGVLVVEAGRGSGSLITARLAAEDHGREVLALPGRVDAPMSAGTNDLIKSGGAHLVTEPGDVVSILEGPSRHVGAGTFEARYPAAAREPEAPVLGKGAMALSPVQERILDALGEPRTLDELAAASGLAPGELRGELTMLELLSRVKRAGSRVMRTGGLG